MWLGVLAILLQMFASAAQGQTFLPNRTNYLTADGSIIPATAAEAFSDANLVGQPAGKDAWDLSPAVTSQEACTPLVGGQVPTYSCISTDLADAGIVDWVLVQMRIVPTGTDRPNVSCADPCSMNTKAALLMSDGTISDADAFGDGDGESGIVAFEGEGAAFDPDTQDLYVAVKHRSFFPLLSATALTLESGAYEHNFNPSAPEVGTGDPEVLALRGDMNFDFVVNSPDLSATLQNLGISSGVGGYQTMRLDSNLDTNVTSVDLSVVLQNLGVTAQRLGVLEGF